MARAESVQCPPKDFSSHLEDFALCVKNYDEINRFAKSRYECGDRWNRTLWEVYP